MMMMMMPPRLIVVATLASSLLATVSLAFTHPVLIYQRQPQPQPQPQQQQSALWSSQSPPPQKINPPLSNKEIQEWLDYVPVYTITDPEGKLVYVKPEGLNTEKTDNIFTFYLSRNMAEATLAQLKLKTNPETSDVDSTDLKLSAFALGQIWFDLLMANSDTGEEFRLVANDQDLMGARMLLTMGPEEEEQIMNASSEEEKQDILDKINAESPKFKASSFNEVPVFMISQMRMQIDDDGEPKAMVPMYLNNEDMISSWQGFMSAQPAPLELEPSISLMELHEIVGMMSKACAFDFRNVMLMPPVTKENDPIKTFGQGVRL